MRRSQPLKPGTGFLRSKTRTARPVGVLGQASHQAIRSKLKSKQRAVTATEKAYWSRLASEVGCIACLLDGRLNTHVSIHHIDGRTKPGCHMKVLPLCAPHHQQDDSDPLGRFAVHPNKARFESAYGTQYELLEAAKRRLGME